MKNVTQLAPTPSPLPKLPPYPSFGAPLTAFPCPLCPTPIPIRPPSPSPVLQSPSEPASRFFRLLGVRENKLIRGGNVDIFYLGACKPGLLARMDCRTGPCSPSLFLLYSAYCRVHNANAYRRVQGTLGPLSNDKRA